MLGFSISESSYNPSKPLIGNVSNPQDNIVSQTLFLFKGNTMPQGELTPAQREAQKAKLKEFHEKGKTGEAKTSADTPRPRKNKSLKTLSDRMAAMLPKALDIIENVIDGKEVDKQKVDVAKYVANHAVTLTKAQLQEEADILKYKVDLEKAKVANVIPREDPQEVARALAAEGKHISSTPLFSLDLPDEEYEEVDE